LPHQIRSNSAPRGRYRASGARAPGHGRLRHHWIAWLFYRLRKKAPKKRKREKTQKKQGGPADSRRASLIYLAGATGLEPAISGVTGRRVNRYTTPPDAPPQRRRTCHLSTERPALSTGAEPSPPRCVPSSSRKLLKTTSTVLPSCPTTPSASANPRASTSAAS